MNIITRIAAMLTLATAVGMPLTAQAQSVAPTTPPMMMKHHHGRDPFARALRKLDLTSPEKTQIKSIFASLKQEDANATPDQRKANREKAHQEIEALLTLAQQQQLKAELAKERARWKQHEAQETPEPSAT
jgi:Spy/CpxP family protein refolding chaperone